jgi:predicted dehydrogenase
MKALVVGLGGIGQRHVRNLRTLLGSDCEILAYRVRGLAHTITPQLGIDTGRCVEREFNLRVFDNLDTALAESPEVAFVCNPTSLHLSTAVACARAGCDLFIEKPLSHSLDGLDTLIEACEAHKRVAMVGYQMRFHPCLTQLQAVLQSGDIGRILAVRAQVCEYLPNWHPYEDYRQMYAARSDLGGGVVLSQIHEFDYLYSLFGLPRRIFAVGGHGSQLEIDVEDVASVLMDSIVDGRVVPIHLHQDYLQCPSTRECEVIGEDGKVTANFAKLEVTLCSRGGTARVWTFPSFERNQLYIDELKCFLSCVARRTKPVVDVHAGSQSLRMALAAKRSMACGHSVELAPDRAGNSFSREFQSASVTHV